MTASKQHSHLHFYLLGRAVESSSFSSGHTFQWLLSKIKLYAVFKPRRWISGSLEHIWKKDLNSASIFSGKHLLTSLFADEFSQWYLLNIITYVYSSLELVQSHFISLNSASTQISQTFIISANQQQQQTQPTSQQTGYVLHFCFDKKQILSHRKTALWKCVEVWLSAEFFIGLKNMKVTPRVRKQLLLKASRLRFLFKNQPNQHLKPGRTAWFLG